MRILSLISFVFFVCCQSVASSFSFHLIQEPHTLDPMLIRGSTGSYLFVNLFRSLYRYQNEKGLIKEGAENCIWKNSLTLRCQLNKKMRWSNGEPIKSNNYVMAFQRLIDPKSKTTNSELISYLKNASEILSGKMPPDKLGVRAINEFVLEFFFAKPDPDFLYKLSFPSLAPIYNIHFPSKENAKDLIVNGPYKIKKWDIGKRLYLERNPFYKNSFKSYPEVMVYFIEDDDTALRIYESKKMSFLRRLNSSQIDFYSKKKGFFQVPVARFDYIGFGPELAKYKNFRKALSLSLDYDQLKKLYHALGRPGCPSLPSRLMNEVPCHPFAVTEAQKALSAVPEELRTKRWQIYFSKMGGDDIAKGMEWAQHQWKSNLNLKMELQPEEQGVYLQILNMNSPAIFRKGVNLDRPTCLAGLENFTHKHPENYIRLNDKKFNEIVTKIEKATNESDKKNLCYQAINHLLKEFYIIPLGEIHFTMLENGEFTGWSINELNQLDLTDLQEKN